MLQVDLSGRLLGEPCDVAVTVGVVIVHSHVLDEHGNALGLEACHHCSADGTADVTILGVILEVTAAKGSTVGIHCGGIGTGQAVLDGLVRIDNAHLVSQGGIPGGCVDNRGGEPGIGAVLVVAVAGLAGAVNNTGAFLVHRCHSRCLPAHAAGTGDVLVHGELVNQICPNLVVVADFLQDGAVNIQTHGGLLSGELVVTILVLQCITILINDHVINLVVFNHMGLIDIVVEVALVILQTAFPVGFLAVGQIAGAANILLHGLGDLYTVFIGSIGIIHGTQGGSTKSRNTGSKQRLGLAVGLMLHDHFHAALKIRTVQVAIEHIAVTGIHVTHGNGGCSMIRAAGADTGLVVVVGGCQIGRHRITGIIVSIQTDVENVLALFQNISAGAIGIEGSQIIGGKVDGNGLRLTGFQQIGLLIADQNLCGLLQAGTLNTAVVIGIIGSLHIELNNLLARHLTGVGNRNGDGVSAMSLQFHIAGIHRVVKCGIAQTIAERILDHLVIAFCVAILPLMAGKIIAFKVSFCVSGLIETVADIDAFLVLIVAQVGRVAGRVHDIRHIGVLVVVVVVERGHGGHIISIGVNQSAGGVDITAQDLTDRNQTGFAGMADPQTCLNGIFFLFQLTQFNGRRGVDQDNGGLIVLCTESQQILLILAQLQVSGAGGSNAITVIIHNGGCAFRAGTAEGHDDHIVVAVFHEQVLIPLIDLTGEFTDLGVSTPVAAAVVVLILRILGALKCNDLATAIMTVVIFGGVHIASTADSHFQPCPSLVVDIQILLGADTVALGLGTFKGFDHSIGVLVVLTAGRAGTAVDVVVGHGTQNGDLAALGQRQGVVFIAQQDSAFCFHGGNQLPALSQKRHFIQVQLTVVHRHIGRTAHIAGKCLTVIDEQHVQDQGDHQQDSNDRDTGNDTLVPFHFFFAPFSFFFV